MTSCRPSTSRGLPSAISFPSARQTSRSTVDSSARTTCSIQTTATPAALIWRTMATSSATSGSVKPPATSSSSSSRGCVESPRATSRRLRESSPSWPAIVLARSASPVSASAAKAASTAAARRSPPPCWAATSTFSKTVRPSNGRGTWKVRVMPSRQRCAVPDPDDRPAVELDVAGVDRQVAGDHAEQRGLARTVRPDDAEGRAGVDAERQAVGDDDLPEPLADRVEL